MPSIVMLSVEYLSVMMCDVMSSVVLLNVIRLCGVIL
jgi:hypothetical protein